MPRATLAGAPSLRRGVDSRPTRVGRLPGRLGLAIDAAAEAGAFGRSDRRPSRPWPRPTRRPRPFRRGPAGPLGRGLRITWVTLDLGARSPTTCRRCSTRAAPAQGCSRRRPSGLRCPPVTSPQRPGAWCAGLDRDLPSSRTSPARSPRPEPGDERRLAAGRRRCRWGRRWRRRRWRWRRAALPGIDALPELDHLPRWPAGWRWRRGWRWRPSADPGDRRVEFLRRLCRQPDGCHQPGGRRIPGARGVDQLVIYQSP